MQIGAAGRKVAKSVKKENRDVRPRSSGMSIDGSLRPCSSPAATPVKSGIPAAPQCVLSATSMDMALLLAGTANSAA